MLGVNLQLPNQSLQSDLNSVFPSCRQMFSSVPKGQTASCWDTASHRGVWHHLHRALLEEDGDRWTGPLWLHRQARWEIFFPIQLPLFPKLHVLVDDITFGFVQSVPFCFKQKATLFFWFFLLEASEPCLSWTDSSCSASILLELTCFHVLLFPRICSPPLTQTHWASH